MKKMKKQMLQMKKRRKMVVVRIPDKWYLFLKKFLFKSRIDQYR